MSDSLLKKFASCCLYRVILLLVCCLIICGALVISSQATNAKTTKMTESELFLYSENGIYYFNPYGDCITQTSTGGAVSGEPNNLQLSFIKQYHDIAVGLSIKYGIPWETVVAQGILESASGTSYYATTRNNFHGLGAFDSNPDNAFSYPTPEAGWEGYYKVIANTPTYRNHGVFQGDTITDPYAYLQAIKDAGYATADHYVTSVSALIAMIEEVIKEEGWETSAELAAKHPEWYENAAKNAAGATGGSSGGSGLDTVGFCGGSNPFEDKPQNYHCLSNGKCGYYDDDGEFIVIEPEDPWEPWPGDGDDDEDVPVGELINGGMTLQEAQNFMEAYAAESDKMRTGTQVFDGATIYDVGCPSGTLNNCSAFTQWFLNRYTTLGPSGAGLYQGSQTVSSLLGLSSSIINGGKTPKAYAVMSMGPYTGTSTDGWYNHTGIVLGINKENDQIIIGEASCGASKGRRSFRPRAAAYSLSQYTGSSSQYGPTYAYTDNILKGL